MADFEKKPLNFENGDQTYEGPGNTVYVPDPAASKIKHQNESRPTWAHPIESLAASFGYIIGISSLTRMPYLMYRSGGIVFFVQYVIAAVAFGFPMLLMEMYLGQFTSNGILTCWEMFPLLKGVGYAMLLMCVVITSYFGVINAWVLLYFFRSWRKSPLPWATCDNAWNTPRCEDFSGADEMYNSSSMDVHYYMKSSTQEYWERVVLDIRDGQEIGSPNWETALCLLAVWVMICLALVFGLKVYGKIACIAVFLPIPLIIALLFRSLTLPGAIEGLRYLLYPDTENFKLWSSWREAFISVFYQLGLCIGPIVTISSYNKFNNDIIRDAMILVGGHVIIYMGFAVMVFCMFGFLAFHTGLSVADVVESGIEGTIMVNVPSALAQVPPSPPVWTVLWFDIVCYIGLSTMLPQTETIITAVYDLLPFLHRVRWSRFVAVPAVSLVLFLFGLLFTTNGGMKLLTVVDIAISINWSLVAFTGVICITFMYLMTFIFTNKALFRFKDDIKIMLKAHIYRRHLWNFAWPVITVTLFIACPALLLVVWFSALTSYEYIMHQENPIFTFFSIITAWSPLLILFIIPFVVFLINLIKVKKLSVALENLIKPSRYWGPALPENREAMKTYLPTNKFEVDPWKETHLYSNEPVQLQAMRSV